MKNSAVTRAVILAFMLIACLFSLGVPHTQAGQTLILDSEPGDIMGGGRRRSFTDADGAFIFGDNQRNGVGVEFRTPSLDQIWILQFSPPWGQTLALGSYVDAIDFPFSLTDQPGLLVGGNGVGCIGKDGKFQIKQLRWGPGRTVEAFSAEFEYHCYGAEPALFGEIRFNPTVTLSTPLAKTVQIGESLTFTVTGSEINARTLALTAIGLPPGATFLDHGNNNGTFSWTPAPGQGGIHKLRFQADNGLGDSDSGPTRIAVGDILRVPGEVATIQGAIDRATDAYRVLVAPGTYVENINFKSKQITVTSEQGAAVTIIDGSRSAAVVTFEPTDGPGSVLSGFTLRNGRSTSGGGGIDASDASPLISNNVIIDNEGCGGAGISFLLGSPGIQGNTISGNRALCHEGAGAGILIGRGASAQILDNVITNNTANGSGGGINLTSANGSTIRGNMISANTARSGGAMAILNQSSMAIVQNLITGNRANIGGGIYWLICCNPGPLLVNNTIADNDSQSGSGIFADGWNHEARLVNNVIAGKVGQGALVCGAFTGKTSPIFQFNNVFSFGAAAYGGICANQSGVNGNISADPKFLNAATGDYRLDVNSPATDAGNNTASGFPAADFAGLNRIIDGDENGQAIIDMGAYEFFPNLGFVEFASPIFSVPENSGSALVTIKRRGGKSGQVMVDVATSDGTAAAGSDYIGSSAVLTFNNGETQKTFAVPIINDQLFEGRESLNLSLDNPRGGVGFGAYRSAVLDITEPGVLTFTSASVTTHENASDCAVLTIRRTDGNSGTVTVHYATEGGSATPNIDYTPISGTLAFADGEITKTVCIPVLSDALVEGTETVNVILSDATGGALLGNFSVAVLNISGSDFVAADYFPAEPGGTWSYVLDGAGAVNITVLPAPAVINGISTAVFQDQTGFKEFYTADGNGIRLHGFFTPRVPIQGLGRVDLTFSFDPPVSLANGIADIGQTISTAGVVRTNELPRIGIFQFNYSADFTVAGFDRITVPAGEFDIVRLQGTLNISGQPEVQTLELAEGLGIVRSTTMQAGVTQTLELVNTNVASFTVDASPLPDAELGVFYRGSVSINGISPPYKLNIDSGSLPAGLTIDDTGQITGTPDPRARSASFTVRVTQNGSYVLQAFKINIVKALQLKTSSLKRGVIGKNYGATFKLSGGKAPYQWSLLSGRLPAGLSFNILTGAITGVPTEVGSFPLTLRVTDPLGGQAQKVLTLTIR